MGKARAFANKEREFQVQRISKLGRATLMLMATLLSFAAVALLAADQLYRPDTFVIQQLKIKGKFRHLSPASIEKVLVDQDLGNFFSVELDEIKRKVEELPWIYRADVRREWPNTLEIFVTEQRPVMRWGKGKWVSSVGDVIDLPTDVNLPGAITLRGSEKDAPQMLQAAFNWKQRLQHLGLELEAVELSGSRAWTLSLHDPEHGSRFDLLLGHHAVNARLARFEYLFNTRFKVANQQLQRVDARYPDGLAVQSIEIKPDDALAANN